MKFTIERAYLAHALSQAKTAISARSTIPVLSHFYLDATDTDRLTVIGTDLDTAVKVTLPYSSVDAGEIALPASALLDYISKLSDGPITFELTSENKMVLRSGHSRYTIPWMPGADFPVVPEVALNTDGAPVPVFTLGTGRLKEMLRLTTFAASREESRSLLMGVLIECRGTDTLNMVATDTHRLARMTHEINNSTGQHFASIVPAKPLAQLVGMLPKTDDDVTMTLGQSQIQFEFSTPYGNTRLISRVLDGQFPNYEKVIPQSHERKVALVREELLGALGRIDIVSRNDNQKVVAEFASSSVTLKASSPGNGETVEQLSIENDGDDLTIAFNAKYLLEVMNMMPDEQIELRLQGALQPGIIYGQNGFSYIVMPMQT